MRTIVFLALIVSTSACNTTAFSEYQNWASKPTPEYWNTETDWAITLLDGDGRIHRTLTVRFTDKTVETCAREGARQLEILHEVPEPSPNFIGEPAYWLSGSALIMDLTANLCDAYTELHGELTDTGFVGYWQYVGMLGTTVVGPVYGVRVN